MEKGSHIDFTVDGPIATVKLNRPEKANAFDGAMWQALEKTALIIKATPAINAVILTGAGNSFCGGLDIKKILSEGLTLEGSLRQGPETLGYLSAVFTLYEQLPVPVIAAIKGGCIGLGMELALACDIRLAAENAVFSIPEVAFGLVPDCGGTQRLPRVVGIGMAKELIYSGRRIDAEEALRIRLVNHVYPAERLLEEAEKLAREIAAHPNGAVQASKRCLNEALSTTMETGLRYETVSAVSILGDRLKDMIKFK